MSVPVLKLIASPNGAGKSTFHDRILASDGFEFVNADAIEASNWPHEAAARAYQASALAAARREVLFTHRTSFATVTVFSHPSKTALARKAVDLGYLVIL